MNRREYRDACYGMIKVPSILPNEQLLELANNLRKGVPIATPVFDGASIPDIEAMLTKAGVDTSGQSQLIDGRTGEQFERRTTVDYIQLYYTVRPVVS